MSLPFRPVSSIGVPGLVYRRLPVRAKHVADTRGSAVLDEHAPLALRETFSHFRGSAPEMHDRLVSTLLTLEPELQQGPRIVTLGLHPHLIGVPHRFLWLERMLDVLTMRSDVSFMTGSQIADWFVASSDPGERERAANYSFPS